MQFIPQTYMMPSPLEGLSEAARTIADAIIKNREKKEAMTDYSLIGDVLAKAQATPVSEGVSEGGDPYTVPAKSGEDITSLITQALPQMKTPQGKATLMKMLMENSQTQPVYAMEGGKLVQKGTMPAGAKLISTPEGAGPKVVGNRLVDSAGNVLYEAPEKKKIIMTSRGPVEVEGDYQESADFKEAAKAKYKTYKPEILVPQSGNGPAISWTPGTPVPEGYTKGSAIGSRLSAEQRQSLVEGLSAGDIDPNMLSKRGDIYNGVLADARKAGVNLGQLKLDWRASEALAKTMNNNQMVRFDTLSQTVSGTIDRVIDLSNQMQMSGIPLVNKAKLEAIRQTAGNSKQGQLIGQYLAATTTLKEEYANFAQGGFAPTESAFKLSDALIKENYGSKFMEATLKETKNLVNIRRNAFKSVKAAKIAGPEGQEVKQAAPAAMSAMPPAASAPGRTIRDTKTGRRYKSNGSEWVEIK